MVRYYFLAGLLLLAGCATLHRSEIPANLELLPVQYGLPALTSEDLEDRVLVLSFVSPYCFGCQRALMQIDSVYRTVGGLADVEVLLLITDAVQGPSLDPRWVTNTYLATYDVQTPAYWDRRARLAQRFDARRWHRRYHARRASGQRYIPQFHTVVLDRNGKIVKIQSGAGANVDRLLAAVEEARLRGHADR